MKINFLLGVLLIAALMLSGCMQGPPAAGGTGGPASGEEESQTQPPPAATEIRAKGQSLEMVISPSVNKEVKGIVTIEASKAPEGTKTISFMIQGGDIPPVGETGPNLCIESSTSSATCFLDTTLYDNGIYIVYAITDNDNLPGPPTDGASAQIIIKN